MVMVARPVVVNELFVASRLTPRRAAKQPQTPQMRYAVFYTFAQPKTPSSAPHPHGKKLHSKKLKTHP